MANRLNYCQANAIKYVTRYLDKNGLEDLRKAIHNIEILIELEYGKGHEGHSSEATEGGPQKEPSSTGRADQA